MLRLGTFCHLAACSQHLVGNSDRSTLHFVMAVRLLRHLAALAPKITSVAKWAINKTVHQMA